jgi:hypothetical protein
MEPRPKLFVRRCASCEVSYWDAPVEARGKWTFFPNLVDLRTDGGSPYLCLHRECRMTAGELLEDEHIVLRDGVSIPYYMIR